MFTVNDTSALLLFFIPVLIILYSRNSTEEKLWDSQKERNEKKKKSCQLYNATINNVLFLKSHMLYAEEVAVVE